MSLRLLTRTERKIAEVLARKEAFDEAYAQYPEGWRRTFDFLLPRSPWYKRCWQRLKAKR